MIETTKIRKTFLSCIACALILTITGCSNLFDEFWKYAYEKYYHRCAYLRYLIYDYAIGDYIFLNRDCSLNERYIEEYKKNEDDFEHVAIYVNGIPFTYYYTNIYFNGEYIFVCNTKDEYNNYREADFFVYNCNFELVKTIERPFLTRNHFRPLESCFSDSGHLYFLDKNIDGKNSLYAFDIWNEKVELLIDNVNANTIFKDESNTIFVDRKKVINVTHKKEYSSSGYNYSISMPVNDIIFEMTSEKISEQQHCIKLFYNNELKKELNYNFSQRSRFKIIDNDVYFLIQNYEYSDGCSHRISTPHGFNCISYFGSATLYKYSTNDNQLFEIREFNPESFIFDFSKNDVTYYYNNSIYTNDEKLLDFDLKFRKDEYITEFGTKYTRYVASQNTFFNIGDKLYYCNEYNKEIAKINI